MLFHRRGASWFGKVLKLTEYESLLYFLDEFLFLTESRFLDPFYEMWD